MTFLYTTEDLNCPLIRLLRVSSDARPRLPLAGTTRNAVKNGAYDWHYFIPFQQYLQELCEPLCRGPYHSCGRVCNPPAVSTQNISVLKKLRPVLSHRVAILNRSSVISDDEAAKMVQALDVAANRDFEPRWHIGCTLKYVEKADTKSWKGYWNVLLLDTSDEAGALGYHDLTPEGLPVSKCFMKTDLQYGAKPSVTVSHELWEMLLDPYINDYDFDPVRNIFVAKEASDAVEADHLAYQVNGTAVSDFVLPPFFNPESKADDQFSFRKNVHRPFELAPGGYEIIFVPGTGWTQNFNRIDPKHEDRPKVGSRRERRLNRRVWTRSAW